MEFIKIKNIELDRKKKKVRVYFELFDNKSGNVVIEFEKKHRYYSGDYPALKIDNNLLVIDPTGWISMFGTAQKNYSTDSVNILMVNLSQYGWEVVIDKQRVYMRYKRKPDLINWNKDNKELRDFLVGMISLANHRNILLKDNSFDNEAILQAELFRLCENAIEKKNLKGLKCKLEHPVGRDFIDLLVTKEGNPFLVIECKLSDFKSGIPQAKKYAKNLKVGYYGVCTENKIAVYKIGSNKLIKEVSFDKEGVESFVQLILKLR